jgi:hypothetical protein
MKGIVREFAFAAFAVTSLTVVLPRSQQVAAADKDRIFTLG